MDMGGFDFCISIMVGIYGFDTTYNNAAYMRF